MIASFDLYFSSSISADFSPSFKKHLNGQNHKSWLMKAKFWFFMITLHRLCCLRGIQSQPPWGHHPPSLVLHFFTNSPTMALILPAPKISPASALSPIPCDGKYKQADYLQKYKKCKSTCIFLSKGKGGKINLGVSFLPGQYFFIPKFVAMKGVSEISALLSNLAARGE